VADDDEAVTALAQGLAAAIGRHRGEPRRVSTHPSWGVAAEQVLTPREAFFADREQVPWQDATGRVCAEVVATYPPGVPVLAPGERITADALDALIAARDGGARIA
jgi:arginine decarboxylase